MKTSIFVTSSFIAYHCWPGAPDDVAFLRSTHRHVFKVRMDFAVSHDDRELEFIMVKRELNSFLANYWNEVALGSTSCEMMAKQLLGYFGNKALRAEVSEDGENGAIVEADEAVAV